MIGRLLDLYSSANAERLYDESVTEHDHALQCAALAVAAEAPDHLVVAALLHDVGHLTLDDNVAIDEQLHDDLRHEQAGARLLAQWFGPEVTAPIALHVSAKRFLCATDPTYSATLSPSSVRSLHVQGGPMTTNEAARFAHHPRHRDAVALRRWDDEAKIAGLAVEPFEHYLPILRRTALSPPTSPSMPAASG